jgi:hypothetical protein
VVVGRDGGVKEVEKEDDGGGSGRIEPAPNNTMAIKLAVGVAEEWDKVWKRR